MVDVSETEAEPQTEPVEPTAPEPEPEPEPEEVEEAEQEEAPPVEPSPESSFAEMERKGKQLDAEATRHGNRVAQIMGEDFEQLLPCPLCWTAGYVWPFEAAPLGDEQRAAVKRAIGEGDEEALRFADYLEACETCNAEGKLKTHSKVEGQKTVPCRACSGQGYKPKIVPVETPTLQMTGATAQGAMPPNGAQGIPPDKWDRPWGHRDFGIPPAQVGATVG